jgi:maleate cis-trans isomerase
MAEQHLSAKNSKVSIGFIGSSPPASPHHESFKALIPGDVEMTFVQESNPGASLWDARGKVDALIVQAARLIEAKSWDGIIVSGGPREVLNPGFYERLSAELKVPVATALRSSAEALKVFGVKRALLMTPVDDKLKDLYRDYLAAFGVEAVYPRQTLRAHTDAQKLSSAEVESMTRNSFTAQPDADGIYFQGALLDPLKVLDKLEADLKVPIVASNPAMLWFILSKLGLRYEIAGYGRLLRSWPELPAK